MTTVIIANVLTGLARLWDFIIGYHFNEKKKIVLCNLLSSSLQLVAMILLSSVAGTVAYIVTLLRLVTIYVKEKYNRKFVALFILYIVLYAVMFWDDNFIVALLLFTSNMCSYIPKWMFKDYQKVRCGEMCSSAFSIGANIIIMNYAVIPFSIFNVVGAIIQLIKWHNNKVKRTVERESNDNKGTCTLVNKT